MKIRKTLATYGPNSSAGLSLVPTKHPGAGHWPIRVTQIIGGKRWSLSFVYLLTPEPFAGPLRDDPK